MLEKGHILKVLVDTKNAIRKRDIVKLKELSNQTIHTASTNQDSESIALAVFIYSLSKIIERQCPGGDLFCKKIILAIENAIKALKKNDDEEFKKNIELIRAADQWNLKENIKEVLRKASINKASKIYEHGISMEKTAGLLGVTMFELASYAGQKEEMNVPLGKTLGARARIKMAEEMFL
jgi:hypothetical protein